MTNFRRASVADVHWQRSRWLHPPPPCFRVKLQLSPRARPGQEVLLESPREVHFESTGAKCRYLPRDQCDRPTRPDSKSARAARADASPLREAGPFKFGSESGRVDPLGPNTSARAGSLRARPFGSGRAPWVGLGLSGPAQAGPPGSGRVSWIGLESGRVPRFGPSPLGRACIRY